MEVAGVGSTIFNYCQRSATQLKQPRTIMLEALINKYTDKRKDKKEVVYQLFYDGKFIIIKGKTLCGSLIIIRDTWEQFTRGRERFTGHLYTHLYNHVWGKSGLQFRVKILARVSSKCSQYQLLKKEQMELDKHRYNKLCLNNATEAYIPLYNDITGMYGWLEKMAVMSFKRWLDSKERKAYIKRYAVK
jgi:hypothetical protein